MEKTHGKWNGTVFMRRIFIPCALLLLVLFAALSFYCPGIAVWKMPRIQTKSALSSGELRRHFDRLQADYEADCEQLLRDFTKRLEAETGREFTRADQAVSHVADELSSMRCSAKLCYKLAKDKLTGSQDFPEAYLAVLDKPVIQPCLHANSIAKDLLQNLELLMRERYTQYSADVALLCGENNSRVEFPRSDLVELQKTLSSFIGRGQQLHLAQAGATIGTAFELLFIRQSCSLIMKLFARPVARIGSSLGTGAVCAVADGPVPVGDIVGGVFAVGGLAWTTWDIYQAACVLPEILKKELHKGIASAEKTLQDESRKQALELVNAYRSLAAAIHTQLEEQLKS